MILRENPQAATQMIRAVKQAQDDAHPRAEGLHVSDLVYCLRKASYRRTGYPEPAGDVQDDTILLMGQGHHGLIQSGCQGEVEKEVHLMLGGEHVTGTIDLYAPDGVPVEIKTTRASSKKPVPEHYLEQLASYVVATAYPGKPYLGRLAIWYLMGDYGANRQPVLKVWDVEFTEEEMIAWTEELRLRTKTVLGLVGIGELADHYGWECGYCPFHWKKGGPCAGGPGRDTGFFMNEELPEWVMGLEV